MQRPAEKILECLSRILTNAPKWWKVWRSRKPENISTMFWPTKDAFPLPNSMEELVELPKPKSLNWFKEDGLRNLWNTYKVYWIIWNLTQLPNNSIWRSWLSDMFSWTQPQEEEGEPTELMVELLHTWVSHSTLKFGLRRSLKMSKNLKRKTRFILWKRSLRERSIDWRKVAID